MEGDKERGTLDIDDLFKSELLITRTHNLKTIQ